MDPIRAIVWLVVLVLIVLIVVKVLIPALGG